MDAVVQLWGVKQRYRNGFGFGPLGLSLEPGIVAVLGLNGAGKSTLLRMLATVTTPAAWLGVPGDSELERALSVVLTGAMS